MFILDTSVTMTWAYEDEATTFTRVVFRRLIANRAVVPAIWPLEVANAILVGERRARITPERMGQFVQTLSSLPIEIDDQDLGAALGPIRTLAGVHNLSAYDASFLELARRRGLPLATLDTRLSTVAVRIGVPLVTERE